MDRTAPPRALISGVEAEITPEPSEEERKAILAAIEGGSELPRPYRSAWRAAALDDLRDDALAEERGGDPGVVEP
jgi:hypothetical protein